MVERYRDASIALGSALEGVQNARILVVGAGGIGCELLKNLVLLGVESIVTIDLDTIDVSNLNRQFLFRKEHVGQSKAKIAKLAVEALNPRCSVEAHHANVKDKKFDLNFFRSFRVVLNALDNIDARRHVNRMCLAAQIPLVEAGTTGFKGQVYCIAAGTACYECFPSPNKKVYPICTIRSTPDKPVHCIVWAQELFKLLFGDPSESMLYEDDRLESSYREIAGRVRETRTHIPELLDALYITEIQKQVAMGKHVKPLSFQATKKSLKSDRDVWSLDECAGEFTAAVQAITSTEFDKDDEPSMRFVTAAANLRCMNFGIPPQSLYAAKGIAGNIIPAIATTNAIVAGLQVAQMVTILKSGVQDCKFVYVREIMSEKGALLEPVPLDEPQASCYVCRSATVTVALDTAMVFNDFIEKVVKAKFNFVNPAIDLDDSGLYDPDDDRLSGNLSKQLKDLPAGGVVDGTQLTLTDFATDLELTLIIQHAVLDPEEYPDNFTLVAAQEDTSDEPPAKRIKTS